jgi:uncharacterized caspase-like protein
MPKTIYQLLLGIAIVAAPALASVAGAQDPAASDSELKPARRWAILIGVEDYLRANDLPFVKNDVVRLAETLQVRGGLPRVQIATFVDESNQKRLPTKSNLLAEIPALLAKCQAGDQVIVYFSGHGVQDQNGQLYLAPSDIDPQHVAETGVSLNWFRDEIAKCKAGTKILLLDACHAGTDKGEKPEGDAIAGLTHDKPETAVAADALRAEFEELNGVVTLCSSTAREASQIWPQREQSLFSYWLNQGLKGHADNNLDEKIDVDELYKYVSDNVTRTGRDVLSREQHPVRKIGPDVDGVPVIMNLTPLSSKQVLSEIAEEIAWAMKDRGLTKLGVLEFTNDTQVGEVLRADFGLLGRHFATQIEGGLLNKGTGKYQLVDRSRVVRKLKQMNFTVDDLADGSMLQRLASDPDAVPVLMRGTLYSRAGRILNIRCELKDTIDGTVLATANGTMELSPNEWGMLGQSATLQPEDHDPPAPQPGAPPAPGVDAQADQTVARLDEEAQGPHPLSQSNNDFGIRIVVKKPDGQLEDRKPRFKGNDCYVTLKKGEVFEVLATHKSDQRVLLRLLIDGLNTMLEDAGGPPGEQLETVEVPVDPSAPDKGVVRKIIGKRVSLDEARPWVLDPKDRNPRNPWWRIGGFASALGASGKVREFEVVDASQSLAAEREFTDQIGIITAAFFAPKGTSRGGNEGVRPGEEVNQSIRVVGGNKECGNLLSVINIHYGSEE